MRERFDEGSGVPVDIAGSLGLEKLADELVEQA